MVAVASFTFGLAVLVSSTRTLATVYPSSSSSPAYGDALPSASVTRLHLPYGENLVRSTDTEFPLPNQGNIPVHDANILTYNGEFYLFNSGSGILAYKSTSLGGPWTDNGPVLNGQSIIDKPGTNRTNIWAPTVLQQNNTFYCFYCVSEVGTRNSAVGLATSHTLEPGSWTDHGALFSTYNGTYADVYPFTISNAIDPAPVIDPVTGKPWMIFGSYWTDIWQIPLSDDLLSIDENPAETANHLSYLYLGGQSNGILSWYPLTGDPQGLRPEEGSYLSYHSPYYYLWYSHGQCCGFDRHALPPAGTEYSIRVGRSMNITGPYVDINGTDLLQGGGQVVYGSNHNNEVYAPGGIGVLSLEDGSDLLYFHYLNKSRGFNNRDAYLGWLFLDYPNGWPVASDNRNTSLASPGQPSATTTTTAAAKGHSATAAKTSSSSATATSAAPSTIHSTHSLVLLCLEIAITTTFICFAL